MCTFFANSSENNIIIKYIIIVYIFDFIFGISLSIFLLDQLLSFDVWSFFFHTHKFHCFFLCNNCIYLYIYVHFMWSFFHHGHWTQRADQFFSFLFVTVHCLWVRFLFFAVLCYRLPVIYFNLMLSFADCLMVFVGLSLS